MSTDGGIRRDGNNTGETTNTASCATSGRCKGDSIEFEDEGGTSEEICAGNCYRGAGGVRK